ncbi:MAG: TIGR03617 family F420-dependent LLM class oxidoreductase [Aldersonia sp.]|nr:TIGR03617 family F420-dependent LLM class oxidoreductase [Aldersonia sp.]
MKVDLPLFSRTGALADVPGMARDAEDNGFDGVVYAETNGDPLLHLTVAAGVTHRVDLLTNIVVAFARSPMTLAVQGRALQDYSRGRLLLGLGSQIKPHIERRFSMPWSSPAARMTEYVSAMRAIWHSWATGDKLDFRGDFYTHTLMTPMFTPVSEHPAPKVFLAAVGPKMTEAAGRVADGILLHPFTTERYFREVTQPALESGRESEGAPADPPEVVASCLIVTGNTEEEFEEAKTAVRQQIAFYGSTPAYFPVLEQHDLADLGIELNALSKSDREDKWTAMGERIDDDTLELFAAVGTPREAAAVIRARWGESITRCALNPVGVASAELRVEVAKALHEQGGAH